jgi:hypothetical protein
MYVVSSFRLMPFGIQLPVARQAETLLPGELRDGRGNGHCHPSAAAALGAPALSRLVGRTAGP